MLSGYSVHTLSKARALINSTGVQHLVYWSPRASPLRNMHSGVNSISHSYVQNRAPKKYPQRISWLLAGVWYNYPKFRDCGRNVNSLYSLVGIWDNCTISLCPNREFLFVSTGGCFRHNIHLVYTTSLAVERRRKR